MVKGEVPLSEGSAGGATFDRATVRNTDRNSPMLLENAPRSFDVTAPKRGNYSAMMLDGLGSIAGKPDVRRTAGGQIRSCQARPGVPRIFTCNGR